MYVAMAACVSSLKCTDVDACGAIFKCPSIGAEVIVGESGLGKVCKLKRPWARDLSPIPYSLSPRWLVVSRAIYRGPNREATTDRM